MSIYTNFAPVIDDEQVDDRLGPAHCAAQPTRLGLTARRARREYRITRVDDLGRLKRVDEPTPQISNVRPTVSPVRLTRRAYVLLVALAVAVIAAWSAVSLANAEEAVHVQTTNVVVRSGETVDDVAARTAGGRDAAEVAQLIVAANGLADSASIDAGEVLVVPGS